MGQALTLRERCREFRRDLDRLGPRRCCPLEEPLEAAFAVLLVVSRWFVENVL